MHSYKYSKKAPLQYYSFVYVSEIPVKLSEMKRKYQDIQKK